MTRAQHIRILIEKLNKGEKVVAGAAGLVGAGLLAHHVANKYGIDVGHHAQKAMDKVHDFVHGTTTTRTSSHTTHSGTMSGYHQPPTVAHYGDPKGGHINFYDKDTHDQWLKNQPPDTASHNTITSPSPSPSTPHPDVEKAQAQHKEVMGGLNKTIDDVEKSIPSHLRGNRHQPNRIGV